MCGIAGIVNLRGGAPASRELGAMAAAMVHRGPDSEGTYRAERIGLTMRRLSIIDVEHGSQPIANETGSVVTVFNGEIYNYRELRRLLEARGHRFTSGGDTETIVHLYEEYGDACVERLRGMFAFAVWDVDRRRLLLARDRIGIKPLYFTRTPERFLFASELKSILALPDAPRALDPRSVGHLFAALCTPASDSIVSGIHKLEPGHVLTLGADGRLACKRYWEFRIEPDESKTEKQLVERLREHLDDAVRSHMVSDVPLGAFLSGGVDSSAVVASMSRARRSGLKTFSIGFESKAHDEARWARAVAARLGTEHHETVLAFADLPRLDELAWHLDEPSGDASALPTFAVSRLAAGHVKVVLSGDGGDELFGGYDKYVVEGHERRLGRMPRWARRLLAFAAWAVPDGVRGRNLLRHFSLDPPERYLDASTLFKEHDRRRLFRPDAIRAFGDADLWQDEIESLRRAEGHWLSALQTLDVNRYLPLDILTKVDRMSMANSIEARVPLLDHLLVEFAATIPPRMLIRGGTTKYLLKKALRDVLPDEILDRKKQGFAAPLGPWLRGHRDAVHDVLLSARSRERGILELREAESFLRRFEQGADLGLHVWTMVSFELWCREFLDRAGVPRPRSAVRESAQHAAEAAR
jgi:asparagine synthase (glutamine-hydrolysing)